MNRSTQSDSTGSIRTTWPAPPLTPEQQAVCDLVEQLGPTLLPSAGERSRPRTEARGGLQGAKSALVDTGLWSLGIDAEVGGGGANLCTLLLTVRAIAEYSAECAVAVAHQHAAGAASVAIGKHIAAAGTACYLDLDSVAALAPGRASSAHWPGPREGVDGGSEDLLVRFDAGLCPDRIVARSGTRVASGPTEAFVPNAPTVTTSCGLPALLSTVAPLRIAGNGLEVVDDPRAAAAARGTWRLAIAATAAGTAAGAAKSAMSYVRQRRQFGGPLVTLPAVAHRLGQLSIAVAESWEPIRSAGLCAETLFPHYAPEVALIAEASLRRAHLATDIALGLHGGYGYLTEYPIANRFADLVSLRASSGLTAGSIAHAGELTTGPGGVLP